MPWYRRYSKRETIEVFDAATESAGVYGRALEVPRALTAWEAETVSALCPPAWRVAVAALRVVRERDDGAVWFTVPDEPHELIGDGEAVDDDGAGVGVMLFGFPERRTVYMLELERDDRQHPRQPSSVRRRWRAPDQPPDLEIRANAAARIREQGGVLYVWMDDTGMKHVRHRPPPGRAAGDWSELEADGLRVFVDPTIDPPRKWVIVLHHFPYGHVDALHNGRVPATPGFGMYAP
jgi:hypothetical protein